MAQLLNTTKNTIVATSVEEAKGVIERNKGLLGRSHLQSGHTLWIHNSYNSIHTFFMKFPIDVIFVDRKLKVKSIHKNIPPWRLIFSSVLSTSVFEMAAGQLSENIVEKGDILCVSN